MGSGGNGGAGPFSGGNSTAGGPFAQAGGGVSGQFSPGNTTWQSGSANGKGWATGGMSGPFSNGQGSGASAGPFHNSGTGTGAGNGMSQTGATGTGHTYNTGNGPSATAPGSSPGGPFTMATGTGDGLPFSPFSVAAGKGSGNGNSAGKGPFAMSSGSGSGGPFAGTHNTGGGNTLTDGSGGILEPSVGSYSGMQHGSGLSWGSNGGQNPFTNSHVSAGSQYSMQGAFGAHESGGTSSTAGTGLSGASILDALRRCPETMNCMKSCTSGYNLHGSFGVDGGCPACTCADGTYTPAIAGTLVQEKPRIGIYNVTV